MPVLLWDASALVKRYAAEAGSATVHEVFARWNGPMVGTTIGYAETFSAVLRKWHRG